MPLDWAMGGGSDGAQTVRSLIVTMSSDPLGDLDELAWPDQLETLGPPWPIAMGALATGLVSVFLALMDPASKALQWAGWGMGFLAILAGVLYRWVSRSRQMTVFYSPNFRVDRLMLLGVLVGFIGVVWNASHIAQVMVE